MERGRKRMKYTSFKIGLGTKYLICACQKKALIYYYQLFFLSIFYKENTKSVFVECAYYFYYAYILTRKRNQKEQKINKENKNELKISGKAMI